MTAGPHVSGGSLPWRRDAEAMRDLVAELCLVPSPSRSERAIADLLTARFNKLGATVSEDAAATTTSGSAGNLTAVLRGGLPQRVVLAAHMDTVPLVEGEQLAVVSDGTVLRSSGRQILGADDKAGVAIVLELVERLSHVDASIRPTVVAVITVCEEIGLVGAQALDVDALAADFGYSFDGEVPVGELITSAVFKEAITLTVRGRRAHAALEPEDGIHAILAAAEVVRGFPLGRTAPDLVANIGRIDGGGATNVVPDEVRLDAEARAFSSQRLEGLVEDIQRGGHEAVSRMGASLDVSRRRLYDGYDLPSDAEPCARLVRTAGRHGVTPRFVSSIGGSDTNVLNQKGLPTVNVGVNMHAIHSVDEWIDAADLVTVCDWVTDALLEG